MLWQHIKKKHQTPDMKDPEDVLRPYYHKALSNEKIFQARDDSRNLEFLEAVCEGEEDKVKDLIRDGVALSTRFKDSRANIWCKSTVEIAAERGYVGVLKALIEAGMDLNPVRWGSVMHDAAKRGHVKTVETMLDAGTDIEQQYPSIIDITHQIYQGPTVLSVAAISRQISTAQMLLDRGAKVDAPNQVENLFIRGHVDVVRILALHDFHHPRTYAFGATMLHLVAVKHECLIEELIDRGSDVDAKDLEGRTPLSYALGRHSFTVWFREINEKAVGLLLHRSNVSEADLATMPPRLRAEYETGWNETAHAQE